MKQIDVKKQIVDRDNRPVVMSPEDPTVLTVGEAISLILSQYKGSTFNEIKAWELCLLFHNKEKEVIELDKSDFQGISEAVDQNTLFKNNGPMVTAQLKIALSEAKEI
jgi:hypothetical protein